MTDNFSCFCFRPHYQSEQENVYASTPGSPYIEPSIFLDGHNLKVVTKSTYFVITISRHCILDNEISTHVKKADDAFTARKHRV